MSAWSTVGSVGVASAADQSKLLLFNSVVQLGPGSGGVVNRGRPAPGSPSGAELRLPGTQVTAVIRYGVDVSPETLDGVGGMQVRYRDGDGNITAQLIAVNFDTGVEQGLIFFDSASFPPPKESFQTRLAQIPGGVTLTVSNENAAFYVELTLSVFQPAITLVPFPPAVSAISLEYGNR